MLDRAAAVEKLAMDLEVQYELDEVTMSPGELFRKWPVFSMLRRIADLRKAGVAEQVLRMTQGELDVLEAAIAASGVVRIAAYATSHTGPPTFLGWTIEVVG